MDGWMDVVACMQAMDVGTERWKEGKEERENKRKETKKERRRLE